VLKTIITNCLKHAFPGNSIGEIHVGLNLDSNRLELTVCDNGIGMPHDIEIDKIKSTGLMLVQALVKQLKGTLNIKVDGGTKFKICIDA
jgi:two-component sensor histidine kinase